MELQRRRKEGTEGEDQAEEESDPGAMIEGHESEISEAVEVAGEEALRVLQSWLRNEDLQELSVAQAGALVALLVHRSGTALGRYLSRLMVPGPAAGERDGRQRSLLPLPLYEDSLAEIRTVVESGEFRRLAGGTSAKKKSGDKAARAMRRIGLLVWHGLSVLVLNHLWTGGGQGGRVPRGAPTRAQRLAQDRIWEQVRRFFDDTAEVKEKVVRAPVPSAWADKLQDFRVSYQGEVVEKAHQLTLEQILPGLPPAGYGGSVPLLELCDAEVRERLEDPLGNLLPEEELPERLPRLRVLAEVAEWHLIVGELYRRGLLEPVEEPVKVRGGYISNGSFGVVKAGKYLPDGRPVLRLIMDLRHTNVATRIITGDVKSLTGAAALQHVVLPEGQVMRMSADDLVAAFYLFALPKGWSRLMTFGGPVPWRVLGVEREGETFVGATVLPMGWSSAVGVLQHAHRRLALRSPLQGGAGLLGRCEIRRDSIFPDLEEESSLWSLYLDDTSLIEIMDRKVAEELAGKPAAEQLRMRQAYAHWGIPISLDKALERAERAEKLGAVVDGDAGVLRCATRRAMESVSLVLWILGQEKVPRKALQVLCGKEVHTLQFRRPLFGIYDYIWKGIASGESSVRLDGKMAEELLLGCCCQALRATDLRAKLNGVVTASDACESGGGMTYASKLSAMGVRETVAMEQKADQICLDEFQDSAEQQSTLVLDFFAGIGGLSRALKMAGHDVHRLIVIESCAECRRLHAAHWPGCEFITDIQKVRRRDLEKIMRSVPDLGLVICGGGSPCQGLSKLSVNRMHLEDPRSALFYKLAEILRWVEDLSLELGVKAVQFVENVVGDDRDIEEMSDVLGRKPLYMCPSSFSRVRRPRLFWTNVDVEDHESFSREFHRLYDVIGFSGPLEDLEVVLEKGWHWPSGDVDERLRWPTFTRAIPRSHPPARPAGLNQCDEETLARWKGDMMRYPPYTYQPQFLVKRRDGTEEPRVLRSTEREKLMGFPEGYTLGLFRKEADTVSAFFHQEVERCGALGNSFHAVGLACLLDIWLWAAGARDDPLGSEAIIRSWHEEMSSTYFNEVGQLEVRDAWLRDSLSEMEEEEAITQLPRAKHRTDWIKSSGQSSLTSGQVDDLGLRVVYQYLRRMEYRGSDVRLDLQVLYRPDAVVRSTIDPRRWIWTVACAYPWKRSEHINVLELRAILQCLEWRARSAAFHSCRFLHLSDSQICLAVLTKGRSSSHKINRILRKIGALCVALNLYPLWAWIASRLNPADEPSRRYEPKA